MDGVIYARLSLLPGAKEFVEWLYRENDGMDTDIIAGIESGLDSVLVLSGITTQKHLKRYPYCPTFVINGVGDITSL